MKTHLTFDFLRGVLVACIARDAGQFLLYLLPIGFPWSAVPSESKGMLMLATVLTIAVYSLLLFAVLFRPTSTTKVVLGILAVIGVLWAGFLVSARAPKELVSLPRMLGILFGPPLTAVIAFFCVLKSKSSRVA